MPRKGAGAFTHFQSFERESPEAAAYFLTHCAGESIEIQTIANRHWRRDDTKWRVSFWHQQLIHSGKSPGEALQETCRLFRISRSKAMVIVGARIPDEVAQELAEDLEMSQRRSAIMDQILMWTLGSGQADTERLDQLTEEHSTLSFLDARTRLGRVMRTLPRTNRPGRVRMRRLLADFARIGAFECRFARLLEYLCGLRPMPPDERRRLLPYLSEFGPEGRFVARFLRAQASCSGSLPKLTQQILERAEDDSFLERLLASTSSGSGNADEKWNEEDPGSLHGKRRRRPHPEDSWDPEHLTTLVNFALAHRRVRVLRIPPRPREGLEPRNREIRSMFSSRQLGGEPATAIIGDLARCYYLSTKQIEAIVYPRD